MRTLIKSILSLLLFTTAVWAGDPVERFHGPSHLKEVLRLIDRLPAGHRLLEEVARGGDVTVGYTQSDETYEGLWHGGRRTITLNKKARGDAVRQLQTIVFELHNAAHEAEINPLWRHVASGQLDKEAFVRRVEQWEHANALRCRDLLDAGIRRGLFSRGAAIYVFEDFETHYMLQQISGHSQRYALDYDAVSPAAQRHPYRGTIGIPKELNSAQHDLLSRYLHWRNDHLTKPSLRPTIRRLLAQELDALRRRSDDSGRQRLAWLYQVFAGVALPA